MYKSSLHPQFLKWAHALSSASKPRGIDKVPLEEDELNGGRDSVPRSVRCENHSLLESRFCVVCGIVKKIK
jgi:hypothetical protein